MSVIFFLLFPYCTGLVDEQCAISNCKDKALTNNICTCTQCKDGYFRGTDTQCTNCYFECRTCASSYCWSCAHNDCSEYINCTCSYEGCSQNTIIACPTCPNGYSLNRGRCYRCLNSDCACSPLDNCDDCLPGRQGATCNETCPVGCRTCNNSSYCTECFQGKYDDTCEKNCNSSCTNGICEKQSGFCCDDTYYQVFNHRKNTYECRNCPENCSTCTSLTKCMSCKPGHWGATCQHKCIGCSSDCDDQGCISCTNGYYNQITITGFECVKCPDHCNTCHNDTSCDECEYGYIVNIGKCYQSNFTIRCPDNCKNGNCDQTYGMCIEGCLDGWSGQTCNETCPPGCLNCKKQNSTYCDVCKIGFYGDKCQYHCSYHCIYVNEQPSCDKDSGMCDYGCAAGYWGKSCSESCGKGCKEIVCNKTTGECLNGCNFTYYGSHCLQECNINCQQTDITLRQCNEASGDCLYGCANGYYGTDCSIKCSADCGTQPCLQFNGTCTIDSGISSTIASENRATQPPTLNEDSGIAVSVGAGAAGVVVIIVVVFFLLLLIRRRRTRRKSPKSNEPLENTNGIMGQDGNVYATISDSDDELPDVKILNEKSEDVATKASPYQAENIEKSDENKFADGETSTAHTTVISKPMIDSGVSDSEKAVSPTISTESLKADDDLVSKEEKEGKEPTHCESTSDKSYYNTLCKRVPVSRLSDYVHNKDHDNLVEEFYKLPRGLQKDHNAAKSSRNASKNRYKAIYPYDESRVILKDGGNDYINASYIKGYNKPNEYIASSGPFKRDTTNVETVSDFWRMVWQEKCETILMLTNCWENTERKCEQYWPELGNSNTYANISVTCVTEDTYADFTIRSFVVTKDDETLNARQLHFTAWPDKGVPADVTSMIEYRQKVRSLHKDETCPLLVHCSAGIGRTGTFIALDLLTFKGNAQEYVDAFGCVSDLRSQRVNSVQTPEQYKYLHHALLHSLTFDCQSITAEKFIETYSKLIKKKDGIRKIESQFKTLQTNIEGLSAADKTARDRNRALTDQNRECADIPGDENRVRLLENRKPDETDYINAVYINGFRSRNRFIVAQTPLPTTVVDFLSMIFQVKCSCVVAMEETDLQDQTVAVYWPAENQVIKHGTFQVRCKESRTTPNYTLKSLLLIRRLGKNEEKHEFDLFIFTNWPCNAAVPTSSDSLLQLVKDVDTRNHHPDEEIPILVHCMTGAERSCLYCAVSVLIEKMEIEHEVSVVNTLRQIKTRRHSAIPTLAQYKFCHQAVISYLQTFDIYSNFELKSTESMESLNE